MILEKQRNYPFNLRGYDKRTVIKYLFWPWEPETKSGDPTAAAAAKNSNIYTISKPTLLEASGQLGKVLALLNSFIPFTFTSL